jgi:hypothetical protein
MSLDRITVARKRTLALALVASLLAPTVAATVYADKANPGPEEIAAARTLGIEGIKLADDGDCAGAIEKLQRAEDLYHAPTILGRLGECQVNIGKIVLGTENLNKVAREELGPKAPEAFKAAQVRAKGVLDAALPRIAKLTVTVAGAAADVKVTVKIDGVEISAAMLGVARPTDPGTRKVEASAPGYLTSTDTATLPEGGAGTVALKLVVDPNAKTAETTPKDKPTVEAPKAIAPSGSGSSNTGGWVVVGIGAAGIAVGSVFGVMALGKKSTLDTHCVSKLCPASSSSDIDSLKSTATISTIGFAVGILGVGIGAAMLLSSGSAEASPPPKSGWVRPWVGLGSLGLRGGF